MTRLLGGLYYNLSSNRFVSLAAKVYCVFITSIVAYYFGVYLITMTLETFFFVVFHYAQYIISALVDILTNSGYFLNFMTTLENIDFPLGSKPKDDIAFSRCLFVGILIIKIVGTVFFCSAYSEHFSCLQGLSVHISVFVIDLIVDLSHLTRIMMFESLSCRIVILRKRIERELSVARRFECSEKFMEKNLRKNLIAYNNLLNTTRQCDAPMKFMVNECLFAKSHMNFTAFVVKFSF